MTHAALTLYDKDSTDVIISFEWDIVKDKMDKFIHSFSTGRSAEIILLQGLYMSRFAEDCGATNFLQNELREREEKEFAQCWILLGQLYWKQVNAEKALDSFLRVRFPLHYKMPHSSFKYRSIFGYYRRLSSSRISIPPSYILGTTIELWQTILIKLVVVTRKRFSLIHVAKKWESP